MRRTCFEQTECNTMQEDMINLCHTAGWNCLCSPVFLGCSAPPNCHPLWFCKVTFCWCYIDAMYRCFSGFAACVGDAAGTWGSIVLSVCVCKRVLCCDFCCLSSVSSGLYYYFLPVFWFCSVWLSLSCFVFAFLCRAGCLQGLLGVFVIVSVFYDPGYVRLTVHVMCAQGQCPRFWTV